ALGRYLRRGLSLSQWDVDYALTQLVWSCIAPQRIANITLHRKQTKDSWARDDPTCPALISVALAVCALAYGMAYGTLSPLAYAWLVVRTLVIFLLSGAALASLAATFTNMYARARTPMPHAVEQRVEWLYAWDVHCNAYTAVVVGVYALHYLLLPLIMRDTWLATLLGNAVYAASAAYYVYITFWGYLGTCVSACARERVGAWARTWHTCALPPSAACSAPLPVSRTIATVVVTHCWHCTHVHRVYALELERCARDHGVDGCVT
ncbi:hypothetical protein EON67_11365, partial [archaeon]